MRLLRKKQFNFKFEKRIIWLMEIKNKRFKTRKALTDYLGVNSLTGERWTKKHITKGIDGLLLDEPKNRKSGIISFTL